jgi:tRNA nucleotidyltransferase/poly(A) polymerase
MAPGLMVVEEVEDVKALPSKMQLTSVELNIQRMLLDVAVYIDAESPVGTGDAQASLPNELEKQKLCLRITGGWVRDKLLGVPSVDIDVAINKMTGYQFGLKMKEYLEIPGNLEKYGLESIADSEKLSAKAGASDKSKMVGGLHKIEANPEKSKHLETTTVRILGLDIDLVNLRKETYSDDSRNPQMEFGTPEEDALRRDATVNAMFYNMNTQQVEDLTGKGYEDMQKKILRTPLEPYQTFMDDPLRVLRLIRFAARLGYTIEDEALKAMSNPDIKDALHRKISRERVGVEFEKALRGPDPHEALRLIFDLDLYGTIFADPSVERADHYTPDVTHWRILIDAVREMYESDGVISQNLMRDKEELFLAWQLAALIPYRDASQSKGESGKRSLPVPVVVAREGIKATNKVSDVLTLALRHQSEIAATVDRLYQQKRRPEKQFESEDLTSRGVLGMAIRRWGLSWRSQVLYSMLVEIADSQDVEGQSRASRLAIPTVLTIFRMRKKVRRLDQAYRVT